MGVSVLCGHSINLPGNVIDVTIITLPCSEDAGHIAEDMNDIAEAHDFAFLLAIMVTLMGHMTATASSLTCQEPENAHLQIASALYDLYTDPAYSNFTLNIAPCFLERFSATAIIYDNNTVPSVCRSRQRHRNGGGNGNCVDGQMSQNGGTSVSASTSCQWEYVLDVEENRIPRVIAKAQCTCLHCHRGTCRHVYSYTPVLFKQCDRITGVYTYRKSIMRVPVGCACFLSGQAGEPNSHNHRMVMRS